MVPIVVGAQCLENVRQSVVDGGGVGSGNVEQIGILRALPHDSSKLSLRNFHNGSGCEQADVRCAQFRRQRDTCPGNVQHLKLQIPPRTIEAEERVVADV